MLLRAAVSGSLFAEGGARSAAWDHSTWAARGVGLLELGTGLAFLVGCLTPLAGVLAGVASIGSACSCLPWSASLPLDRAPEPASAAVMAIAIVLLGPGAFSVDAWLFGRREVVIPRSPPPPRARPS